MHQPTYTIYFDGKIADNFNPIEVKKRAQTVFKLSKENSEIFFNGETHILKENVTQTECMQYLDQLLNFGLIGKTLPPLPVSVVNNTLNDSQTRANKKLASYLLLFILMTTIGASAAWYLGFIQINPSRQSIDKLVNNTNLEATSLTQNLDSTIETTITTIDECTSNLVINSLEETLTGGIPQLFQRSSPTINLTLQKSSDNQELYFDKERNKRLCSVLTQYKIEGEGLSQAAFVSYEIIYEIERKEEQVIQLTIFKQSIVPQTSTLIDSPTADDEEEAVDVEEVESN